MIGKKEHIFIIEDEEDIIELVRYNLEKEGYRVSSALSGEEALNQIRSQIPDLIILDLMLPGIDGLEICKILKNDPKTAQTPIIMLTAKGEDIDIVTGLELGAEDYITKPFSPKVLIARIRAALRRNRKKETDNKSTVQIHNLSLDPIRFEVRVDESPVELTATEFHTLHYLMQHPGWVFTRSQIIDSIKGTDYPVTDRSVDVQIVGLRKKLKSAGKYIETVRGIGYRFKE
ncbi:response regulator [bacterium]|nr:response regulator [bacterium]RQV93249.1 MAG: response regulator [bacterium]